MVSEAMMSDGTLHKSKIMESVEGDPAITVSIESDAKLADQMDVSRLKMRLVNAPLIKEKDQNT
jgi:hypothetical protein